MTALRLPREQLFAARTEDLERLAAWLKLAMPPRAETPRQLHARLVNAIQRAEKVLERAPKTMGSSRGGNAH